ncbi:MAG: MarR family winged helix-turn-helix transcriptional regulator [Motilibacteraceae bacterium]
MATPGAADPLDVIELQSAVLVRHFELLRRRSDVYQELERAEYLLLRTLDDVGPTDICGLAARLGVDQSTAGRQVTTMTERGLVRREPSAADRRRAVVSLTAEGRRLMGTVRERRRAATAELLHGWSDEDLALLGAMFHRYNDAVAEAYLR